MIHVFQPALESEELEAVRRVFESNWPGKGKLTDQFEAEFARHLETDHELLHSVNSCTEGLFQAVTLLGIGAGDEVVLPSISFVGAANAVAASGARPVFCDVDPDSLNCTAATIERCLSPKTKAVLLLHYAGVPCGMEAICELVASKRLLLIEDNACSVASRFRGEACGLFGDVSVWSFDSMKMVVTGDGGMIWCRTREMAEHAGRLLCLGLGDQSGFAKRAETRWWEFEVTCSGRRAITNDIASAIGIEQLKKLPRFLARRRQVHAFYTNALGDLGWVTCPPCVPEGSVSSYYLYRIRTQPEWRDRLAIHLRNAGIYTTFRYFPLHRVPFYGANQDLPNAERAGEESLCLPLHSSLSDDDLEHIVTSIQRF